MSFVKVLEQDSIRVLKEKLKRLRWADGRDTARGSIKLLKQNDQLTTKNSDARSLLEGLVRQIMTNPVFKTLALPRTIVSPRFARYYSGGHYDWHVDYAHMEGFRTDISFTLFISSPEEYEGGELHQRLGSSGGLRKVKGESGTMFLYPTGALHKVTPVTSGERIVMVGWVNSYINSIEDREALVNLNMAQNELRALVEEDVFDRDKATLELNRINESYFNLFRSLMS